MSEHTAMPSLHVDPTKLMIEADTPQKMYTKRYTYWRTYCMGNGCHPRPEKPTITNSMSVADYKKLAPKGKGNYRKLIRNLRKANEGPGMAGEHILVMGPPINFDRSKDRPIAFRPKGSKWAYSLDAEGKPMLPKKIDGSSVREGNLTTYVTNGQRENLLKLVTGDKPKRTRSTPEQKIQKEIIDMWETFKALVVKINQAGVRKPDGSYIPPRTLGVSDLIICYKGLFIAMEIKTPDGVVSVPQNLFLGNVRLAGGISCVVFSLDDAIKVKESIDKLLSNR